ncbi:hypothetical protein V7S43_007260 [Phytophthora oleae]|uniref:Uncharacterized protein n=1 Tax=Phytophthora oleae TaxID=2107226 RepID=A0ABD3FMS4_9STRA
MGELEQMIMDAGVKVEIRESVQQTHPDEDVLQDTARDDVIYDYIGWWFFDTAANAHVTGSLSDFVEFTEDTSQSQSVHSAALALVSSVAGVGTVALKLLQLSKLPTHAVSAVSRPSCVRFIGPFKVVSKKGLAYTLDLPKRSRTHPVFYVGLSSDELAPRAAVVPQPGADAPDGDITADPAGSDTERRDAPRPHADLQQQERRDTSPPTVYQGYNLRSNRTERSPPDRGRGNATGSSHEASDSQRETPASHRPPPALLDEQGSFTKMWSVYSRGDATMDRSSTGEVEGIPSL